MPDDTQAWTLLCEFMHKRCGVALSPSQSYLMNSRLDPVVKKFKFASVLALVNAVCAANVDIALKNCVIDAMTTHETSFFRDASFWKSLEEIVLPEVIKARPGGVRILVTACSHGQEVYSLAILLAERFADVARRCQIIATDVSEQALERARLGVFTSLEVNRGLTAPRLIKYFDKAVGGFCVNEGLRKAVSFAPHNLLEPLTLGRPFDLILCRNVLIYFDDADRKKVLRHLRQGLNSGGYIGLGTGELYLGVPISGGLYASHKLVEGV